VRIASLQDYVPAQLADLLNSEADYWRSVLFWDYGPIREVLERYIGARLLPGFVLLDGDIPVGYSYYVLGCPVAFVGSLFVLDEYAGAITYASLLSACGRHLQGRPEVQRIEGQLFEFNYAFTDLWVEAGFHPVARRFMVCDLAEQTSVSQRTESHHGQRLPPGWRVSAWRPSFLDSVAFVIYDSYLNSLDAAICYDYRTLTGCRRFLSNLVENPACGTFLPDQSLLLWDSSDNLAAVLLASRISPSTAMIPQISVVRQYQGHGFGRFLLDRFLSACRKRGWHRVTLSVSEENERAFKLYERCGFRTHKPFNAYLWNRTGPFTLEQPDLGSVVPPRL